MALVAMQWKLLPLVLVSCATPRASAPSEPPETEALAAPAEESQLGPEAGSEADSSQAWDWDPRAATPGRLAFLDDAILKELQTTWNVRSVVTRETTLRVQTGMRTMDERVFRAMLPLISMVYEQEGGMPRGLERIEIVNRFGTSGWVLNKARILEGLLQLSMQRHEELLLEHTEPLS